MNEESAYDRLLKAYTEADKHDGFKFIAAALQAGLNQAYVEEYMSPSLNLDDAQLMEQLAAINDGLPAETLKYFSRGEVSAEDMKNMRMQSRNDEVMAAFRQEISDIRNALAEFTPVEELRAINQNLKMLMAQNAFYRERMRERQELATEQADDKEEVVGATGQGLPLPKKKTGKDTGVDAAQKEADQTHEEASADDAAEPKEVQETATVADMQKQEASEKESGQEVVANKKLSASERKAIAKSKRILRAIYRKLNDKTQKDETKKQETAMRFINQINDLEKLEAILEACQHGIPYEHLEYVVDPDANAKKIRLMTEIYDFVFCQPIEACA